MTRSVCKKKHSHASIIDNVNICSLTDDVQLDEEAPDGLRADLALVPARVPPARLLDLQHPLVPRRVVVRLVARVRRVREPAHGEDVEVAVPDPRHLQNAGWKAF